MCYKRKEFFSDDVRCFLPSFGQAVSEEKMFRNGLSAMSANR
jgi:hypothetical protein